MPDPETPSVEPDPDIVAETRGSGAGEMTLAAGTELAPVEYSTHIVEVFPNVVAVLGEFPADLEGILEPINTGLLSVFEHDDVNKTLALVGGGATVGGNLAEVAAGMRGLYRLADQSQALLNSGARLAIKDGANLGTILLPKGASARLAQARFTPATGLGLAGAVAAIGPALAMIALQSELNRVSTLVERNLALTSQVIETTRRIEQATLMSLVETVDRAMGDVRAAGGVPKSLWETVASKKTNLDAERKKYRSHVASHINKISDLGGRQRREYLQQNAEAIVSDAFALLHTMKAWTGYQAIAAAVAREAGIDNPAEAKHFESIVENTRADFQFDLAEVTRLLGSLDRELRLVLELQGPTAPKWSAKRKDHDASRQIASRILTAIAPLCESLLPPNPSLDTLEATCAPPTTDLQQYLDVLRWLLEPGERVRVVGLADDAHARGAVAAAVGAARDKVAATLDRAPAERLVAVSDKRIMITDTRALLKDAAIEHTLSLDTVRYVRSTSLQGDQEKRVDLITRDHNYEWRFGSEIESSSIDSLAAILAESMTLPDDEREDLLRLRRPARVLLDNRVANGGVDDRKEVGAAAATVGDMKSPAPIE